MGRADRPSATKTSSNETPSNDWKLDRSGRCVGVVTLLKVCMRLRAHSPPRIRHGCRRNEQGLFTRFLVGTLMPAAARCQDGAIAFVCMDWRHMTEATARPARIHGVAGFGGRC